MALSANAAYSLRNTEGKKVYSYTVKTSAKIYKHALVAIDVSAGTVLPAANTTTTKFAGIALAEATTGDGTITVEVATNLEVLLPLKTVVTQGNTHAAVYAFDDADVTDLTTLGPQIGILTEFVAANSGWVWLGQGALSAAS